jgi:chemotaxis protein methyltransferase CheR
MEKIKPEEMQFVSYYIHEISGISLEDSKAYLVETRLNGLLNEFGCNSYQELCMLAKNDSSKKIERKIIDGITTNETLFFRDEVPFELLQHKILPDLVDKRMENANSLNGSGIKIWSAACSTGQEVFSIAMVLKEVFNDPDKYDIKLLGTDISDEAIAQASYGQYSSFEIERGLTKEKLTKYFNPNGNTWKIKDEIRAMTSFKKLNLMIPFPDVGKFDIIFCRNVAIYFNLEDRKDVFKRIGQALEPDGYLIIGSTESLAGICPEFEPKRYLRSVFYQLKNGN